MNSILNGQTQHFIPAMVSLMFSQGICSAGSELLQRSKQRLGILARTAINNTCVSKMHALALLPASPQSEQQCVGQGRDCCCLQSAAEGNCALHVLQH